MKPEITWSLMHPTQLDPAYMRSVVKHAAEYDVDSFEICGAFASRLGGMNGLLMFDDYPKAFAACDKDAIEKNRGVLRSIVEIAHSVNKPLFYWHREVTVPPNIIEDDPGLLDEHGEFNLLGTSFEKLLRYKIQGTFAAVPELDGLVLTLTEADFSAIHNSRPEIYPPEKVVEKVVRIFAMEIRKLKKRFILRSFGSIAEDYKNILNGARSVAGDYSFEIETKITPYDFVPFLSTNPFLRKIDNTTLCAECDSLGEFLGAGYLPSANISNIVRYVREGQRNGVGRYAIRLDRIGNSIFNCHEINLFAYHKLIANPDLTEADIWNLWAIAHWPDCQSEMIELAKTGLEAVKKIHYIARNVIFHKFPILPDFQWIKAGGIFSLFKNDVSLKNLSGIWSIMSGDMTPGRIAILAEKDKAIQMIDEGIKKLDNLKWRLASDEYIKLERVWKFAKISAISIRSFVNCICAYFDDMESKSIDAPLLRKAIAAAETEIKSLSGNESFEMPTLVSICEGATLPGDDLGRVYMNPLRTLCHELLNEFNVEFKIREEWEKKQNIIDFVIPGCIFDDWRISRYMHASHAHLRSSTPVRYAGNTVFPNGFFEVELKTGSGRSGILCVSGLPEESQEFKISVDGTVHHARFDADGNYYLQYNTASQFMKIKIEKSGSCYPAISGIGFLSPVGI